jgi:hypothetical protein
MAVESKVKMRIVEKPHNKRMQSDFGKLRLPQPLMRAL